MTTAERIATVEGQETPVAQLPPSPSPLNASPHPGSAFSVLGHSLGTPPDGRTRSCSHLCPLLESQGLTVAGQKMHPHSTLGRKNRIGSYLVKSSSASMCLGMGE